MISNRRRSGTVVLICFFMISSTLSFIPIVSSVENNETASLNAYSINGHTYQYDGTIAGGYAPLLITGCTVEVTWWNITSGSWQTIITVSDAFGEYNTVLTDYADGGVVYCNVTNNPVYGNNGYNYTYIDEIGSPGGIYQKIICGVPYDISWLQPIALANELSGSPFNLEWIITDIDGLLAPGYFTTGATDRSFINITAGPIPPVAFHSYIAPADVLKDGTADADPGHFISLIPAGMTIYFPSGLWYINVSEGGQIFPDTFYLTPWGNWYLDPSWTIPGWLKDWDNITINVMGGGSFDWELIQGWNLVSCPGVCWHRKGANPFFDSEDALNWTNTYMINTLGLPGDPELVMLNRTGGNPSTYQRYDVDTGEGPAFPIDNVHGYWVYTSLSGPNIIHFGGNDAPTNAGPNMMQVDLTAGWNLMGWQHNSSAWSVVPTASMFTDGTVSASLDIAGPLAKIVVSTWMDTKWFESFVVNDWFPGMVSKNWAWDFSYSTLPGNGYMIWVDQPVTITYSTVFGNQGGGIDLCGGGSAPPPRSCSPPSSALPKSSALGYPQDPYPIYGYVYNETLALIGAGADIYVEWENKTGTIINDPTPGAFPYVTDATSQYSVDMFDYALLSTIWANLSYGADNGADITTVDSPPMGGEQLNLSLGSGPSGDPDIWADPLSFDFVIDKGDIDTDILTVGNDGPAVLYYNITGFGPPDCILDDTFDGEIEGVYPANWAHDGSYTPLEFEIDNLISYSVPHSLWLKAPSGAGAWCHHDVNEGWTNENLSLMIYMPAADMYSYICTQETTGDIDSTQTMAFVGFRDDGTIRYYDGASWVGTGYTYTGGWHKLDIVMDVNNDQFDLWYDDTKILTDGSFSNSGSLARSVQLGVSNVGSWRENWFDDIRIFNASGGGPTWLSVNPDNGVLAPSTDTNHVVTVNTTGLAPGFYQANITIESNDPDEPTITIPVNLTVIDIETFEIALHMGWNLLSFPLIPKNSSLPGLFESIDGNWDVVQAYNATDPSPWKTYATFKPPSMNDLFEIDHKMGFWLHVTDASSPLKIKGDKPVTTDIPLYAGWNLVGYPTYNTTTMLALAFFGTGADRVDGYDAGSPYLLTELPPTYIMMPGEGYWVHVPADSIWTVENTESRYPIHGTVYLYDGTSAGGYNPLPSSGGADVDVTWHDSQIGGWNTISTTTNAAGLYSVDITNCQDGGVVYINATFEAPYNNNGYNYTYIDIAGSPGGMTQEVVCGIPYNISWIQPIEFAIEINGMPFNLEWIITDINGLLAPGYFTTGATDRSFINITAGPIPPGLQSYIAPANVQKDGTADADPGHFISLIPAGMTIYLPSDQWWYINVSEGGQTFPDTSCLTPWGQFHIDPFSTIPGWYKDWDNITIWCL